jgi:hypothetical protein
MYNGIIMRTMNTKTPKLLKLRAKNGGTDIFYSYSNWNLHEIDGEEYYPVVKEIPSHSKTQVLHYMKKNNMEVVK